MHTITNELTGNQFSISDKQSILDAALAHGVALPYGCQKGFCGKCKGVVTAGEVSHTEPLPKGISQEEFEEGFVLMCQCEALSDVSIAVDELVSSSEIEPKIYPCKVVSLDKLSSDVISLKLKTPSNDSLQFLAGQYIDLWCDGFESRSFSIANSPNTQGIIELHIRLVDDGKFTQYIFNQLTEKTLMQLEGPKGSFYLRDNNKPIIMLAGGTGFGPIKSMMESYLLSNNRPVKLYWGAQTKAGLYSELPKQWDKKYPHIDYIPVLSAQSDGSYRTGFAHEAVLADYDDLSEFEVYACGAPMMVQAAADTFIAKGLPRNSFYADAFEFQTPNK